MGVRSLKGKRDDRRETDGRGRKEYRNLQEKRRARGYQVEGGKCKLRIARSLKNPSSAMRMMGLNYIRYTKWASPSKSKVDLSGDIIGAVGNEVGRFLKRPTQAGPGRQIALRGRMSDATYPIRSGVGRKKAPLGVCRAFPLKNDPDGLRAVGPNAKVFEY